MSKSSGRVSKSASGWIGAAVTSSRLIRWRACSVCCVFFFQAEDGIRDVAVTGVQTCALPILLTTSFKRAYCWRKLQPIQRSRAAHFSAEAEKLNSATHCSRQLATYQSVSPILRSEEHTSELQSRLHLVCRLLLEKKKNVDPSDTLVVL